MNLTRFSQKPVFFSKSIAREYKKYLLFQEIYYLMRLRKWKTEMLVPFFSLIQQGFPRNSVLNRSLIILKIKRAFIDKSYSIFLGKLFKMEKIDCLSLILCWDLLLLIVRPSHEWLVIGMQVLYRRPCLISLSEDLQFWYIWRLILKAPSKDHV